MAFGKTQTKAPSPLEGKSLSDLFTPATQLPTLKWLKMGVWGSPKVGKTHFALTNPKGKIFVIDTEGSIKVNIQAFPPEVRERVYVFDVLEHAITKDEDIDYDQLTKMLEDIIKKTAQAIKEEGGENVTIVVDSATDIWEWLSIWNTSRPGVKHIGSDGDKVNRLEWGTPNKRYAEMFRNLLYAQCNVILTFLSKETVNDSGQTTGDEPRWQKNTFRWLDVSVRLERIGNRRVMKFTGSKHLGGRLIDNVPDLENPDWTKMCAHIAKHTGVKFE